VRAPDFWKGFHPLQATFSVLERGGAVGGNVVGVNLAGFAAAQAHPDQLAALRKNPGLPVDTDLSPGFLKHSDDQTIIGLAAISQAMASLARPTQEYQDWGLVAAPNLFGRFGTLQGLLSFRKDGAWGVSPHTIPHHSLHAVSGTISQALHIHGPNFGISGGPKAVGEAFLVAATMLSENNLPGLWVVLTGTEPEYLPSPSEAPQTRSICLAVALALKPLTGAKHAACLQISGNDDAFARDWPEFTLADFHGKLETKVLSGRWTLPGCGWVLLMEELP
jgi:hypothetical protein